jgi:hypothetical protein
VTAGSILPPRNLILDENISKQLGDEIHRRGRPVDSVVRLFGYGILDGELLQRLAAFPRWVLVTLDDDLPWAHEAEVAATQATIATLDSRGAISGTDTWVRDIVHRFAHRMQAQGDGEVRRYSATTHRLWAHRK